MRQPPGPSASAASPGRRVVGLITMYADLARQHEVQPLAGLGLRRTPGRPSAASGPRNASTLAWVAAVSPAAARARWRWRRYSCAPATRTRPRAAPAPRTATAARPVETVAAGRCGRPPGTARRGRRRPDGRLGRRWPRPRGPRSRPAIRPVPGALPARPCRDDGASRDGWARVAVGAAGGTGTASTARNAGTRTDPRTGRRRPAPPRSAGAGCTWPPRSLRRARRS